MGSIYASRSWVKELVGKVCLQFLNNDVYYQTPRWLQFDPTNHKGLIIKKGTRIRLLNGKSYAYFVDTKIDFSSSTLSPGTDYFVYLDNSGTISIDTDATIETKRKIGRFHTLCVDAGTITMIAPASPSSSYAVGDTYLVKPYDKKTEEDFYNFYNKTITAKTTQSAYDIITMNHPLSGFKAGEILPESVMCLSFRSDSLFEDAQVYDRNIDRFVDVYIQSGMNENTRSAYNKTHTTNRTFYNLQNDQLQVGKRALLDYEFTSAALGSNEKTSIYGSADQTYVGGHKDTASRRMISAIGCEEMCGYVWQVLSDVSSVGGSGWVTTDTHGSFGQEYGDPYVLRAGGNWASSSSCGSCARISAHRRSSSYTSDACRGSSHRLTEN